MRPLLALFIRSLRDDVRARSTYIGRAGLVGLILFFLWTTHEQSQWAGAPGREFFTSVLWIDLFILSVVGLSYFASAVAEEKDDDTLGLLRMTDLNALSILLGKSTSRLLGALFIIAAQLPFMLVAVTMGGLDVRQVIAGFSLLIAFAFHLANLALVGSVVCARTSSATGMTAALLAVFALAPGIFSFHNYVAVHWNEPLAQFLQGWIDATPTGRLETITATGFHASPFGWHFVVNVALGFVWFGIAWALFDRHAETTGETTVATARTPSGPGGKTLTSSRYGRPSSHALRWKDFYFTAGGVGATMLKTIIAILAMLYIAAKTLSRNSSNAVTEFAGICLGVSSVIFVLSLAIDASRIFKNERRDQTLSSLALLPHSIRHLVWEKARGCFATNWPLVAMISLSLAVLAVELLPKTLREFSRHPEGFFFAIGLPVCFIVSAALLPLSIAWMSLRVRWGGLPLGLTAWFLGNQIAVFTVMWMFREGSLVVLPLAGTIVGGMLIANILQRLEILASGE